MPASAAYPGSSYGGSNAPDAIDLRSDTVTRPDAAMRQAIAEAEVGDDVYGDDPSVNALESHVADLMGKEAAVYCTSGTQSNLSAMLAHCQRGEELIAGAGYHVLGAEAGGSSALGGIVPCALPTGPDGGLDPDDIDAAVKPDDPHYPITRLLCLENTMGGKVQGPERLEECSAVARRHGLSVHLDGARLMNAVAATGRPASDFASHADTVSLCLSKGLGAPCGTVLSGPADIITRARRQRKLLGGAMRQAGFLAAAGLHALSHNVTRLADDHARTRRLAEGLAALPGFEVDLEACQTNMVFVGLPGDRWQAILANVAQEGLLIGGGSRSVRLVCHKGLDDDAVDRTLQAFQQAAAE
ncbi:MAG: low-specificity L-threonine aldolase [Alphaproteobacteria bacterium]|nr:low-specificity L-threonine aldolase [Rhodospirillaceae bacterium]MBT6202296.1 low-specificity L-threonine aldolase [Rhodospirillaceae bacterium]MBT7611882.1 low-specificity L-threonine aldolase [Rhodospirillaceae bacterium]MBT7648726.1 low-specificity L-threonine aldolase [Rhodospirillaceae bacterium]MDG2482752.1 low-specificity L-threonine aldolase [Alphaproteobacteria bacterium]